MSNEDALNRIIVLDNLPEKVQNDEQVAKLETWIGKRLGHRNFRLKVLRDDAGNSFGGFLTLTTTEHARAALEALNAQKLGKNVIKTFQWIELQRAREPTKKYDMPDASDKNTSLEEPLVHNMAEDDQARPQYLIKGGGNHECKWYWFNWESQKPEFYRGPRPIKANDPLHKWSEVDRMEKKAQPGMFSSPIPVVTPLPIFSTYGTYVISQSPNGLSVWGGASMTLLYEIEEFVSGFMVSPSEKYIVIKTEKDIRIYDILTARRLRIISNLELQVEEEWPLTRFSADDTLFAVAHPGAFLPASTRKEPNGDVVQIAEEVRNGAIAIYVAASRESRRSNKAGADGLTLEKKGLRKVDWNPVEGTQLAYSSFPSSQEGWRVDISTIHLETVEEGDSVHQTVREEPLTHRNFVGAERVDMLWHPTGTHLAMKVTVDPVKHIDYYLADVTTPNVMITQLTVTKNHYPYRFAWMPNGASFALILINPSVDINARGENFKLQIYTINRARPKLLGEFATSATNLFWAPQSGGLVAVNFDFSRIQFLTVTDNGREVSVREENKVTNTFLTNCQWDPTGRYFAAWVSTFASKKGLTPQYTIFDAKGNVLFNDNVSNFSHFAWRPLPPGTLSAAELAKLRNSADRLYHEYLQEKEAKALAEQERIEKERRAQEEKYCKTMERVARQAAEQRLAEKREALRQDSKWYRYWSRRLKDLPENERTLTETITREKIISRKPIENKGSK